MNGLEKKNFKYLVLNLCEIVTNFNEDLKKGIFTNVIEECDNFFKITFEISQNLNENIIIDKNYGINLELMGISGKLLFPAILYKNGFRKQIIREIKYFLKNDKSIEELGLFLHNKIIMTQEFKKGGFSKKTLEILRFYLFNFNKVIDNDITKYSQYEKTYNSKYVTLSKSIIQKRFHLTQKYSTYYLLPRFHNFGLNGLMFHKNDDLNTILEELKAVPFGFFFNNQKQMEFLLFFSSYKKNFKTNYIEKICFFENLDMFLLNPNHKTYYNKSMNILDIYYNYKDGNFKDTAISFDVEFANSQRFKNQFEDLDLLIHIFNTRKLPSNHQIHPLSTFLFNYRIKIVNFYSTIRYFIYINDPKNNINSKSMNFLIILLRNCFSNGYIIQNKNSFLISTFLFKKDFENIKKSFLEFFIFFKLEVKIFENLNFSPISFYYTPNSTYFSTEDNSWKFPNFQNKAIRDLIRYQIDNLELERLRLKDKKFNNRIDNYLENWTNEINSINQCNIY